MGSNPSAGSGDIAQSGERLLCKQEVGGSIPPVSTTAKGLVMATLALALAISLAALAVLLLPVALLALLEPPLIKPGRGKDW